MSTGEGTSCSRAPTHEGPPHSRPATSPVCSRSSATTTRGGCTRWAWASRYPQGVTATVTEAPVDRGLVQRRGLRLPDGAPRGGDARDPAGQGHAGEPSPAERRVRTERGVGARHRVRPGRRTRAGTGRSIAIGMTAHVAEVTNLTGLGDVCGQFRGGCLAKDRARRPARVGGPAGRRADRVLPLLQPHPDARDHRRSRARGTHQRRGGRGAGGDRRARRCRRFRLRRVRLGREALLHRERSAAPPRGPAHHRGGRGGRRRGVDDHARQTRCSPPPRSKGRGRRV